MGEIPEARIVEDPTRRVKWLMDITNQVDRLGFWGPNLWENGGNPWETQVLWGNW